MREIWIDEGVRLFAVEDGAGPVIVMLPKPVLSQGAPTTGLRLARIRR